MARLDTLSSSSEVRCRLACGRRAQAELISSDGDALGLFCAPCGAVELATRNLLEQREAERLGQLALTPTAKIDLGPRPPARPRY